MEAESVAPQPRTAAEWIELCIRTVVDAQREALAQKDDPEPPEPTEDMTHDEFRAASDRHQMWVFRHVIRMTGGKRTGNRLAATAQAHAFLRYAPPLTTRANTKAFIACLAVGLQRQYLTGEQVKMLMYTAQLALMAHRPRSTRRYPTPSQATGGANE